MTRTLACVLCAALLPPGFARADPPREPAPGMRVRLTAPEVTDEPLIGRLTAVESGDVVLHVSGRSEPVVVPRALVEKWEVSRGQQRNVGRGAGKGLLVGAAVGAGLGGLAYANGSYNTVAQAMVMPTLGMAAIGAGVGAIVGLARSEKWDELEPAPLQVGLMPVPGGGAGVSVSWSFAGRK